MWTSTSASRPVRDPLRVGLYPEGRKNATGRAAERTAASFEADASSSPHLVGAGPCLFGAWRPAAEQTRAPALSTLYASTLYNGFGVAGTTLSEEGRLYEITRHKELLLFHRFASQHPAAATSLLNVRIEHVLFGHGTIVEVDPDPDGRNGTRIHVLFDGSGTPREGITTGPKKLSMSVVLQNGLLKSLAIPSDTVEAFRSFSALATRGPRKGPSASLTPVEVPSLPPRKKEWGNFAALVKRHHIGSLYHFTDARNLESIRRNDGLYSWWQCRRRGIRIPAPGGDQRSRRMDEEHALQDYVRLGFNPRLPMMYVAQKAGRIGDIEILQIDPSVIYLESTLFSNMNANDREARLGISIKSFERVDFRLATGTQRYLDLEQTERKLFQAEVLVKSHVPLSLIRNL